MRSMNKQAKSIIEYYFYVKYVSAILQQYSTIVLTFISISLSKLICNYFNN